MLGEDHELLVQRALLEHLVEQARKLDPLPVVAASPHVVRRSLQEHKRRNFRPQFLCRSRRRRLVEDLFLDLLHLVVGGFLEVVDVVVVQLRHVLARSREQRRAVHQFHFAELLLQPLATTTEGLIDGFRGRRQPALKHGECESDGVRALLVLQVVGLAPLLPHVVGDGFVELRFGVRQLVRNRRREARLERAASRRTSGASPSPCAASDR